MKRPDWDDERLRTPYRAARKHQGSGHWHVERRSSVLVCRARRARIPRSLRPAFCPECGAGSRDMRGTADPQSSGP